MASAITHFDVHNFVKKSKELGVPEEIITQCNVIGNGIDPNSCIKIVSA